MKKYGNNKITNAHAMDSLRAPINRALKDSGITLDRLCRKLSDLIDANRSEEPDNPTQIKALDMGLKLHSAFPAEKKHITHDLENLSDEELDLLIESGLRETGEE